MKTIFYTIVIVILAANVSNAQLLQQGDNAILIGVGFPDSDGYNLKIPTILGVYDHGFTGKLGIGNISGGGQLAFSQLNSGVTRGLETNVTIIHILARSSYHFDFVDIAGDKLFNKFDIYAGLGLGFEILNFKDETVIGSKSYSKSNFIGVIHAGCKYAFADKYAAFVELGSDVTYLSFGLSVDL